MTKSPATCWNAGRFIGVIVRGQRTGSDGRRDNAAEASSEKESAVALRHFSHWPCRIGSVGTRGPSRGVSGARRRLRHEGAVQGGKRGGREQKRRRELLEKRRGTSTSLYLAKDRAGRCVWSDAIPDAAGGEGDHGAARADRVVHSKVHAYV